jgi:hypothetical protein
MPGLPSVTIAGDASVALPPCGRRRRFILIPSRLRKLLFDLLIEIGLKSKEWKDREWSKTAKQQRRDIGSRKAQPSSSATEQFPCLVRNLSATGAAIEVPNQPGIPTRFELNIPRLGLSMTCRVAWRRDHRMGVAFIVATPDKQPG